MTTISLRDYQVKAKDLAIASIQECGGFGLFMEQRTGKTLTAISIMSELKVKRLLVICPKRAIPVWHQELGRIKLNDVTVINFESAWRREKELLGGKYDGLIVDESHRIKERGSTQSKFCWKLALKIPQRLILTGTPTGNGNEDLYSQFKVLNPKLWPRWGAFEARYLITERLELPGRPMFKRIVGYQNVHEINQALLKYSYRITRAEIERPKPIRIKKHYVKLDEANQKHYRALEKKLITTVQGKEVTTPLVLTQALRLHQLCGGFLTDDDGQVHKVGNEKLVMLENLLSREEYESIQWVVVARYLAEIDSISALGNSLGMSVKEISGRVQYDPLARPRLTILQPQSGLAIDLSYATHLVVFSQDYSYLNYAQFKDRIAKIGGSLLTYHFILVQGKMDEIIYEAVVEKKKLANVLMSIYNTASGG